MGAAQKQMQIEEQRVNGRCVVITGSREWTQKKFLWLVLNAVYVRQGPFTMFHGDCHLGGADRDADEWGRTNPYVTVRKFPATDYGPWPACGPIRNEDMVRTAVREYGRENVYGVAFPRGVSKGTRGTIELMVSHGISYEKHEHEDAVRFHKR